MALTEPSPQHVAALRKHFGYSTFRSMQWEIIHCVLHEKRDTCVVMSTGYGKSLCYQYPAVFSNGLTIVVSPLISLMKDQVLSLEMANIKACFLGSAQTSKANVMNSLLLGEIRVLYVTPEWISSESSKKFLHDLQTNNKIVAVAIDEAHCISQWGFDFRSSYRHLGEIRNILPSVPIMALTATATPIVRTDICASLNLRNLKYVCTGFDRKNLYFEVSKKTNSIIYDLKIKELIKKSGLKMFFEGSTIIYCPTKKLTEAVAAELKSNTIACEVYHGDISLEKRNTVHEAFVKDNLQVVVATVAFGMGINKPDVRQVIHYGAPKDIELYYQEVGRAGRDGLPATCHVFYNDSDITLNRKIMFSNLVDDKVRAHKEKMAKIIEEYLKTRLCRRQLLLSYFEDSSAALSTPDDAEFKKDCCDNCTSNLKIGSYNLGTNVDLPEDKGVENSTAHYASSSNVTVQEDPIDKLPNDVLGHHLGDILYNPTPSTSSYDGVKKLVKIDDSLIEFQAVAPNVSGNNVDIDHSSSSLQSLSDDNILTDSLILPDNNIQEMMKKLNIIHQNQEIILERLSFIEQTFANNCTLPNNMLNIIDTIDDDLVLPLSSTTQVNDFEKQLESKSFFKKQVDVLKLIGGNNINDMTTNILKRLLTNAVAEKYSFMGLKKKLSFKDLLIFKLLLTTIRTHSANATEEEIKSIVSYWLNQAKTRCQREKLKMKKQVLPNQMVEKNVDLAIDHPFSDTDESS